MAGLMLGSSENHRNACYFHPACATMNLPRTLQSIWSRSL